MIEQEDIYFLSGLNQRGRDISLFGSRPGGLRTASYMARYCNQYSKLKHGRINIKTIVPLELNIIAFTFNRSCGSATPHVATKAQIHTAIECSKGIIFNQCKGFLVNMKGQITRAKNGRLKKLGYGAILVSYALERISLLAPHQSPVDPMGPREPRILQWV